MKKVTGIGGVFFKCNDPKSMNDWYANNLGLPISQWGTAFEWRQFDDPEKTGTTAWSTFSQTAKSFEPCTKEFMINYRVENITALVDELKAAGVTILDDIDASDYGKFVHILDPEGNKIELWEPNEGE